MTHSPLFPKYGGVKTPQGVIVTGTHPKCGKTTAAAGISGALAQLGFRTQAIKPLHFQAKMSIHRGHETHFFNKILPPIEAADPIFSESAHHVSNVDWHRALDICQRRVYSYILETPGSLASPVRFVQDEMLDAIDLAKTLNNPLLLVTTKQPDIMGILAPAFAYAWKHNANLLGWIAVETTPVNIPDWDTTLLYLNQHYQIPYLGEIAYSPSISVETLQQGNLIRTTELGVDLLPIQQTLELLVP